VKIGSSVKKDRQRYYYVGFEDYENRFGHCSELIVLRSRCAECGAPFRFMTTPGQIKRRALNRRCDVHKKPGVPVQSRRRPVNPVPQVKPGGPGDHDEMIAAILG
jgi:hypothetical protein